MHPQSPAEENDQSAFKSSCSTILQAAMKRKLNTVWYTERILKFSRQTIWDGEISGAATLSHFKCLNSTNNTLQLAAELLQAIARRKAGQKKHIQRIMLSPDPAEEQRTQNNQNLPASSWSYQNLSAPTNKGSHLQIADSLCRSEEKRVDVSEQNVSLNFMVPSRNQLSKK